MVRVVEEVKGSKNTISSSPMLRLGSWRLSKTLNRKELSFKTSASTVKRSGGWQKWINHSCQRLHLFGGNNFSSNIVNMICNNVAVKTLGIQKQFVAQRSWRGSKSLHDLSICEASGTRWWRRFHLWSWHHIHSHRERKSNGHFPKTQISKAPYPQGLWYVLDQVMFIGTTKYPSRLNGSTLLLMI